MKRYRLWLEPSQNGPLHACIKPEEHPDGEWVRYDELNAAPQGSVSRPEIGNRRETDDLSHPVSRAPAGTASEFECGQCSMKQILAGKCECMRQVYER